MKKIKSFIQYMKETTNFMPAGNSTMLCSTCDASGYIKDKDGKSKTCPDCKGAGQRKFKRDNGPSKKI